MIGATHLRFGPTDGTATTAYEARMEWFGTLRGRVGFLLGDQLLAYGTGGLAYGRVRISGTTALSGTTTRFVSNGQNVLGAFAFNGDAFDSSKTNVGFSVGAGVEGKLGGLAPHWTWKLEYLYVDLGSLDAVSSFNGAIPAEFSTRPPSTATLGGTTTVRTRFTDSIVRLGLNYRFH